MRVWKRKVWTVILQNRPQWTAITIYQIPCIFLSIEFYRTLWFKGNAPRLVSSYFKPQLTTWLVLCWKLYTSLPKWMFPRGIREVASLSPETPFLVFASYFLSLGKLLLIISSFWFTQHHKTVLKSNNENKAFYKISPVNSNRNNPNTCKANSFVSLPWKGLSFCTILLQVSGMVISTD